MPCLSYAKDMQFDVISIGDSVVDTFVPLIDAKVVLKKGEKKLMFNHGAKVPVGPSISVVGGNAAIMQLHQAD